MLVEDMTGAADLAVTRERVADEVDAKIVVKPSNDPRSYRVNSDKLLATGFEPKKSVRDAIREIVGLYRQGVLKNEKQWHNLRWMQDHVAEVGGEVLEPAQ